MTKSISTSKKPRKQHTPEFRSEALKLAERIGVAAAARELSLYESQLYNWRSKQQSQTISSERESEQAAEIARLKRQLAERDEELAILQNGRDILREAPEMKYVFIEKHRAEFSVKAMCRVFQVARNGWYVWRSRRHQVNSRQRFRLVCDDAVSKAFNNAKQWYGAPRLSDELPDYNVKTIAASLRRQGLRAKAARKFSPVSYLCHLCCYEVRISPLIRWPNLLNHYNYNRWRRHCACGGLSPEQFENQNLA